MKISCTIKGGSLRGLTGTIGIALLVASCQTAPRISQIQRLSLNDPEYTSELEGEAQEGDGVGVPDPADSKSTGIGYFLYDPSTRKVLDSKNENSSFIPGSTTKILTTVAALKVLGPDFRFKTEVAYTGTIEDGILHGDLYLKGGGDPSLFASHLMSLVRDLEDHHITKITGNFYFDESELLPQSAIRKSGEISAPHNSGIGALSVNFNQAMVKWAPARDSKDSKVNLTFLPDLPLFEVLLEENNEKKGEKGGLSFDSTHSLSDVKDRWKMAANSPLSGAQRLPVKQTGLWTAQFFAELCKLNGIHLPQPQPKVTPKNATVVGVHLSPPLLTLVDGMLEYSNNLMAELVLLATSKKLSGHSVDLEQAGQILNQWFANQIHSRKWGQVNAPRLYNASGLTSENRISPSQMVSVLDFADRTRYAKRSYESLLSVGGWKGTLANRLDRPETAFRVWAKTGSLSYVSSLAGYLHTLSGKRLVFAIMAFDAKKRDVADRYNDSLPEEMERDAAAWGKRAHQQQDEILRRWGLRF